MPKGRLLTFFVAVFLQAPIPASAATAAHETVAIGEGHLQVVFAGNGGGIVHVKDPDLTFSDCGSDQVSSCTYGVVTGSNTKVATLTAEPEGSSGFDGWSSGVCKEQGTATTYRGLTCTVTVTGPAPDATNSDPTVSVTATFAQQTVALAFAGNGTGRVSAGADNGAFACLKSCSEQWPKWSMITVNANPDPGFGLGPWKSGLCNEQGQASSYAGPTCTFLVDSDKEIIVTFGKAAVQVAVSGSGAVTSTPAAISCTQGSPGSCTATVPLGQKLTLVAAPAAAAVLGAWPNGLCDEQGQASAYAGPACTLTLSGDQTVLVIFSSLKTQTTTTRTGGSSGPVARSVSASVSGSGKSRTLMVRLRVSESANAQLRLLGPRARLHSGKLGTRPVLVTHTSPIQGGSNTVKIPLGSRIPGGADQLRIKLLDAAKQATTYTTTVLVPS